MQSNELYLLVATPAFEGTNGRNLLSAVSKFVKRLAVLATRLVISPLFWMVTVFVGSCDAAINKISPIKCSLHVHNA